MSAIFLGPWRYWLIWLVLVAALFACGRYILHVREFISFIFIVLALAAAAVAFVLTTHRRGERVTREPIDEE